MWLSLQGSSAIYSAPPSQVQIFRLSGTLWALSGPMPRDIYSRTAEPTALRDMRTLSWTLVSFSGRETRSAGPCRSLHYSVRLSSPASASIPSVGLPASDSFVSRSFDLRNLPRAPSSGRWCPGLSLVSGSVFQGSNDASTNFFSLTTYVAVALRFCLKGHRYLHSELFP